MRSLLPVFVVVSLVFILLFSCEKPQNTPDNLPPEADFFITPNGGDTSVLFLFDARQSSDPEQKTDSLLYRWDFTGYHQWSAYSYEPISNYKYEKSGTYEVMLEVKDKQGWTDRKTHTLTVTN